MPYATNLRRGALFMVLSALLFALMGAAVKAAARSLPNESVVFFRSAFGLLALLPWLPRLGLRGLATSCFREHLVRALAGLASMYCFFFAIAHLRLADAVLLNYSMPLYMPFISRFWLGERVPQALWWSIGIGFLGVVLILRPGLGLFNPVSLVGVAAAVFAALAQVGVRRLTRTEPVTRIVFYFGGISTLVSALPMLRHWVSPGPEVWQTLIALGVVATLGQLLLTRAYAHAPAAQVGPFLYSAVVFAALLDGLFWGKWPDLISVVGSILVCFAGIMTLRRQASTPTRGEEGAALGGTP